MSADYELVHGYTLLDLEKMTRAACVADRTLAMDYHTKRDIAYSAITLALYEAERPPERGRLIRAGWQAIYREVRDTRRQRGYRDASYSTYDVRDDLRPRVIMYWDHRTVSPSHEDRVVERLAVHQALSAVTGPYLDAVLALAAIGDYQRAAAALEIEYAALSRRLITARQRFLAAWFGDETPHRIRSCDRRVSTYRPLPTHCPSGHEYTPENTRLERRMVRGTIRVGRRCIACQRIRDRIRTDRRRAAA